jgi:hypothetical protein
MYQILDKARTVSFGATALDTPNDDGTVKQPQLLHAVVDEYLEQAQAALEGWWEGEDRPPFGFLTEPSDRGGAPASDPTS